MTTSDQSYLLNFLRQSNPGPAAKSVQRRSTQEFVLEFGWWYEPTEVPKEVARGTPKQCHTNAIELATNSDSFIYCEGYALLKNGSLPTIHAWVTDGQGRAIDNTWPQPGVAYLGVPFQLNFVLLTSVKNNAAISLLDDFMNKWPLLNDLGDRPDEWLELGGRGVGRLASNL